jgi:hypothetical protein
MAKYAQPILYFFCRPCGQYELKTHPHYRAQKQRAYRRRKKKETAAAEQQPQQQG